MNKIERSINSLFEKIPESSRKQEIVQEIIQDFSDKVSDLVAQGQTEDEAMKAAMEDFGDIEELKKELESGTRTEKSKKLALALAFSIWGVILTSAFFVFINLYYTPYIIWFVYPVFAVLWWPIVQFFRWRHFKYNKSFGLPFSISSYLLVMALLIFTNYYFSPNTIWFVYPAFGLLWWPLAMIFNHMRSKESGGDENDA